MLKETPRREVLILDTSAFIAGFDPLSFRESQYSVPAVQEELTLNSLSWTRFQTAVESKKLIVKNPESRFIKETEAASKAVGDLIFLSEADQQVLSLALEMKKRGFSSRIVTDDYSIQNVANKLGIEFAPLMTFGIRYRFTWTLYCPACYNRYQQDHGSRHCDVCGTRLKRKPAGKRKLTKQDR